VDNQPLLVTAFGYTLAVGTVITDQVAVLGDTGDKDQNTHQAHAGYIGSTDNK